MSRRVLPLPLRLRVVWPALRVVRHVLLLLLLVVWVWVVLPVLEERLGVLPRVRVGLRMLRREVGVRRNRVCVRCLRSVVCLTAVHVLGVGHRSVGRRRGVAVAVAVVVGVLLQQWRGGVVVGVLLLQLLFLQS